MNTIQVGSSSPAGATLDVGVLPFPVLQSVGISPTPVNGGSRFTATLMFTQIPPAGVSAPPPLNAQITVDQPGLVQLPASVPLVTDPTVLSGSGQQAPRSRSSLRP